MLFALDRDEQGEWFMAHHTACQGRALEDIAIEGSVLGVPRAAASAVKSKLVQEEAVDRIKNAAVETATRTAETLLNKLPSFFGGRGK